MRIAVWSDGETWDFEDTGESAPSWKSDDYFVVTEETTLEEFVNQLGVKQAADVIYEIFQS